LHGIEPTGRAVGWHSVGAIRFAGGQAVERWGIGNSLSIMQQLGVLG
jgi:predicted ester cyclase